MKAISSALAVLSLSSSLFAGVAAADQCVILSESQLLKATNIINYRNRWIGQFCEPCGDMEFVQTPVSVLGKDGMGQDKWLLVNGEPIDAAYTYTFDLATQCWNNLAYEVGCYAERVTPQFCL